MDISASFLDIMSDCFPKIIIGGLEALFSLMKHLFEEYKL